MESVNDCESPAADRNPTCILIFMGILIGLSFFSSRTHYRKIVELDAMLEHIQTMRDLLEQQGKCRCTALEECGTKMFEKECANDVVQD